MRKGFTLIELLVVISIIALLSSIVLTAMTTARDKAEDAAVKQQLSQMKASAELIFSKNGNFDSVCDGTSESSVIYLKAFNSGTKTAGQSICVGSSAATNKCLNGSTAATCATGGTGKWAASVQLKGESGSWYCVDYSGVGRVQSTRGIDTQNLGVVDADC